MVASRRHRKGGCIIGNLSTSLSDTHEAFRQRLARCFDEMALEFQPHLARPRNARPGPARGNESLARYIVAVIEGSIMLRRTGGASGKWPAISRT